MANDKKSKQNKTLLNKISRMFRVKHLLQKIWALLTWRYDYKVVKRDGIFWLCNMNNFIDRQLGVYDGYEKNQIGYLIGSMKEGCDCFIDIGSNIGLYTMYVAKSGYAKEIYAFEPDHRNYSQLNANLYLNKLTSSVVLYKLGLSDKENVVKFKLYNDKSTGQSRIVEDNDGLGELVEIKTVAADSLFDFSGKKIFVKIDVEGHEQSVIGGAEKLFKNNKCFIQCETWDTNYEDVKSQFEAIGYKQVHKIEADTYFTNF